ncbi:unnamed protein product [Musa acuminata subsp. malaccensis]|uniref:(wild Malaysian banana) hypothetical protein n=1 Tax=Musa acuminata subsp. malaccensis TaxID=214687 RepID=A0A804I100_MUSAM|nr:PREDICTED: pentatricopeptide repeat-containing protein DOT4, chloroplastic-like [Musa acuminata subsp. malaccensis]CAG1861567.1 unnamed protein product [Musa acuminata subsp. malaccensis]
MLLVNSGAVAQLTAAITGTPAAAAAALPSSAIHRQVKLHQGDTAPQRRPRDPSVVLAFDEKPERAAPDPDAALIRQRGREGRPLEALALFRESISSGLHEPDDLSVATVLNCCASLGAIRSGREVHGVMIRRTQQKTHACSSETSLVSFYAKCGILSQAREVFDQMTERDVVAWTVMLKAYADREGYEMEMMHLFADMLHQGMTPNCHTLSVVLGSAPLELGEQLHAWIVKLSFDSDAFIGSSLVDVYARNGNLGLAQLVFDRIQLKDVVCYNCLILGYGRTGVIEGLVSLFVEMCLVELAPNQSTFVGLLSGCAFSGFISLSKQFHAQAIVRGFDLDEVIQGIIVDMYAKCGNIEAAHAAFNGATIKQNVAIWNSMICGYGKHGNTEEALRTFNFMVSALIQPDHITFICLLSACSHSGLVDEGWRLFCLMHDFYGIPAREEHYSCMVDLFGRTGRLNDAYELISRSMFKFTPSLWGALLSACRVHGNTNMGEVAARKLFELEPECSGSYVALANIYAAGGQWEEANAVREIMDDRNIRKDTGCSWIEVGGLVHKFRAGGGIRDHNCMEEVYLMCHTLYSCACDQFYPEIVKITS